MAKEIVSQGAPYTIDYEDRTFNGGRKNAVTVSDVDGTFTHNTPVVLGGYAIPGTPSIVSTTGLASNTVTLQMRDAGGNNLPGIKKVYAWVSATAGATAVGTDTTGLTTTVTVGALVVAAELANLAFECLTDATGKLQLTLADAAGTTTRFVNFAIGEAVYSSAAVITP